MGRSERHQFGPFLLDCRTRELWRDGTPVNLTPKAFDLLRVLVAAGNRVMEKNELMRLVWPDSFVSEDSLTQHVAALRRALGDVPERPQYILTVPRHGYRFIAPIRAASNENSAPSATAAAEPIARAPDESEDSPEPILDVRPPIRPASAWRTRQWIGGLTATVLIAGVLVAWIVTRRTPATPQVMRFVIAAPDGTTLSPSASFPAVSPDGRWVAFLAARPGEERRLWVRALDRLSARELAGTDGALSPFWSPDSQYVGFFAGEQLKIVSLLGEPPTTLCDVHPGHVASPSAAWNHAGVILFSQADVIFRVSSRGGMPAPVTSLDAQRGETAHILPQFLPDEGHFLYVARGTTGGSINSWVVLGSLEGPEHQQLLRASSQSVYADPGYLLFVRDGILLAEPFDVKRFRLTGVARPVGDVDQVRFNPATPRAMFSVSQTGLLAYRTSAATELSWFDRNGRPLGSIGAAGRDSNPALAPDGRRVAVTRYDPTTATRNLWILDLGRGGIASPFTSGPFWANCPVWSPDGTRIVFASRTATSGGQLYEKSVTGAIVERDLPQRTNGCPLDWSLDGRYLLNGISPDVDASGNGVWIVPLAGGIEPKPLPGRWSRKPWARISPNGRWVAYVSDATGRNEIYVRSFPSSDLGPWQISTRGGIEPQWRSDGRELFFIGADKDLMAVRVATDADFSTDAPTALFTTGLDPDGLGISGRNQYVVAPDGSRFLLNQPRTDETPAPITVVVNWTAAIGK